MIVDMPQLNGDESVSDLIEHVAKLQKMVQFLMNGKISSNNVREIGGYNVNETDLMSMDGDVGLSSADDAVDPVRIWAGDADKDNAPWRVAKSGKMFATGADIRSASGYPRVELNAANNLVAAYADPDTYVAFIPQGASSVPTLVFVDGGTTQLFLNRASVGGSTLGAASGEALNFQTSGNLQINGVSGATGSFFVSATSGGPTTMQVSFAKGIRTG